MSIGGVEARIADIRARMAMIPAPVAPAQARNPSGIGAITPLVYPQNDFSTTLQNTLRTAGVDETGSKLPVTGVLDMSATSGPISGDSTLGSRMAAFATQYVGVPYVAGGNTPESGWDCAAFTDWVATQHGMDIPPVSWEQIKVGQSVPDLDQAKPGDLLFFHMPDGHRHDPSPLKVNHVGMYLGNGQMVEAANHSAGTRIGPVDTDNLVAVRRLTT